MKSKLLLHLSNGLVPSRNSPFYQLYPRISQLDSAISFYPHNPAVRMNCPDISNSSTVLISLESLTYSEAESFIQQCPHLCQVICGLGSTDLEGIGVSGFP